MERDYITRAETKIKSVEVKAVNAETRRKAEVRKELSTEEGKKDMMNRIFGNDKVKG